MKQIICSLFTCLAMSTVFAVDKTIAFYVGHANGGLSAVHATALSEALKQRGWKVDLKIIGNCGQVLNLLNTSNKPILAAWGAEWNTAGHTCHVPISKQNFVDILHDSPRLLCGPPNNPNFQFEKGQTYRIGINQGQYHDILLAALGEKIGVHFKPIEYRNSGFIIKGMHAKEIDVWYANKGLIEHAARTQKCLYGAMNKDHDGIIALSKVVSIDRAYAAAMAYLFINDKFSSEQGQLLIKDIREIILLTPYQNILSQGGNFSGTGTLEDKITAIERNSRSYSNPDKK